MFVDVLPFKGLGVVPVILSAGCVSNVPDGCDTGELLHDRFAFASVRKAKDFADNTDIFDGF
jgi:hypothetical protein